MDARIGLLDWIVGCLDYYYRYYVLQELLPSFTSSEHSLDALKLLRRLEVILRQFLSSSSLLISSSISGCFSLGPSCSATLLAACWTLDK